MKTVRREIVFGILTIAEKILAKHSGRDKVSPGELVQVKVDAVMMHDLTAGWPLTVFAPSAQVRFSIHKRSL